MLKELALLPVYDSSEKSIVDDLMIPCLCHSVEYLRGVGYFTSGWLTLAASGIESLARSGGRARFVVSPVLDEADKEALALGSEARESAAIYQTLKRHVDNLASDLEVNTRNTLAWLVADRVVDFSFAIPRDMSRAGNYHDKVGVCIDPAGDKVAFHGSFNDSLQGSLNGEAFSVFRSWEPGQEPYVAKHESRLRSLIDNNNSQFYVCGIPDAIRDDLIALRTTDRRPYDLQDDSPLEDHVAAEPTCPCQLRSYQKEAIEAWADNDYRGLFEMATGTGKTITSLEAARVVYSNHGQLALIILVPYLHLADQWVDETKAFGFSPVVCSSANPRWKSQMVQLVDDYSLGTQKHICLIAVHQTASTEGFRQLAQRIDGQHMLLLADETHALGARHLRKALMQRAEMRLGLSATPDRWLDEEGTAILKEYYSKVVFDYPLEKAIGTFLTPYQYHPLIVSLTVTEAEEYAELSKRIAILAMQRRDGDDESSQLKHLLIRRARILWTAEQKYPALLELLQQLKRKGQEEGQNLLKHLLLYCAPGEHKKVLKMVRPLIDSCHRFVHDVKPKERKKVLSAFQRGDIDALVAIKCLDEGVDIPATRTAILMASTSNPREFIQRRGRVLRKHEGKKQAVIYDFVVLPPEDDACSSETARSLLLREMPRFAEFASCASNQYEARQRVRDVVDRYGMLHLLDMRPWDLHRELLRERGGQLEQQFTADDMGACDENK